MSTYIKRRHRKRHSLSRLSTDTVTPLPAYYPSPPPDYPDSADEADEDTADEDKVFTLPALRHPKRPDPSLDTLLARSVHALEMSNALLQSSMSTHSSVLVSASSSTIDCKLPRRREPWMDDLDEISKGVEGLFSDEEPVSRSLPSPRPSNLSIRTRPSLQTIHAGDRTALVSPPPRALTLYLPSSADPSTVHLPSTLGLRGTATATALPALHGSASQPVLTHRMPAPSTPAYNLLSSLVARSVPPHSPPSGSGTGPSTPVRRRGSGSTERPSLVRFGRVPYVRSSSSSPSTGQERSRSLTPGRPSTPPPTLRPMTPPIEELSSSSSDHPIGYRAALSLRRILDEQSPPPPPKPRAPAFHPRTPAPAPVSSTSTATASVSRLFTRGTHSSSTRAPSPPRQSSMKKSAPPSPSPLSPASFNFATPGASTSNQPDPPGPSSLAPPPQSAHHSRSSSTLSIPDIFSLSFSRPPSGRSTPKRISFAALPESYAGSKDGSTSVPRKSGRKRRSGRTRGKGSGSDGSEKDFGLGWFANFLLSAASPGHGGLRYASEERAEERMGRGWSGRSSAGLDEWAV